MFKMLEEKDVIKLNDSRYKGLVRIYFRKVMETMIGFGGLGNEEGLILDFGCGSSPLKKILPDKDIVGYDIIDELSDVRDYSALRPSVIFCNGVFVYLTEEELRNVFDDFRKMNSDAKLVVCNSKLNLISKIGKYLVRRGKAHDSVKIDYRKINKIISNECNLLKRKAVFNMCEVSLYEFK